MFNAFETEGGAPGNEDELITDAQLESHVRVVKELTEWKPWVPRRPFGPDDLIATLYEHREMVRFGAEATACPSERMRWPDWMKLLGGEDMWQPINGVASWWSGRKFQYGLQGTMQVAVDFPHLPLEARAVELEEFLNPLSAGKIIFKHGNGLYAGQLNPRRLHGTVRVQLGSERTVGFEAKDGLVHVDLLGIVGYWT